MFKLKETKVKTISALIIAMFCLGMIGTNIIPANATILAPNLKVELVSDNDIKVSWEKDTKYDGYRVMYKKASKSIIEYNLKGFYNSSSSVTLNNLSDGIMYNIKVTPYTLNNGKKVYHTSAEDVVKSEPPRLNQRL